ncbi:sigma-54 dependent transcriptional regulator [Myxococcota bacterium]|nr:sigma-54 dependent transcriptional regulator [Myxococcota bacterium]MBU1536924.1 sigma-54 dependent transcriptional regulator [Myxococcota bacterium]
MITNVLIADDEPGLRKMLSMALTKAGHRVESVGTAEQALSLIETAAFDVVVSDLKMPGMSGLDLLKGIKRLSPETEVIIMTAHGTIESAMEAVRQGAFDYIQKPFSMAEMELTVLRANEQTLLRRENLSMKKELDSEQFLHRLVGKSKPMQEVFALIRRAAPSRANVLLTGASGTGKELVARALHNLSKRSQGPFLAINCGAIPEQLLESELFGHIKGSFTGAETSRPGLFQAAKGGTILLDEIGEMPLSLQVKLLRVLQEKKIKSVGDNKEVPVDVRIIASTNRNLSDDVKEGSFREDLFYRLNVIHISIPSLKDRKEDILPIAHYLLSQLASEAALPLPLLTDEVQQFLKTYSFPGNVRELENMLERAVVLHNDQIITIHDLGFPLEGAVQIPSHMNLDEILEELERKYITEALAKTGWNRTETAKFLGISFRSLRYRMAKLDLAEK